MTRAAISDQPDLLGWWINANGPGRRTRVSRQGKVPTNTLRFAFYGRDSTEDYQDRLSSSQWQRDFAEELITGRGAITVEYFDTGVSRRIPWNKRPQARQLLNALDQPNRPFDAVVIGEFERAFYADQYTTLAPVFTAHGIQLWLPELEGPVDPASELHMSLLALLGTHSRREVQRARFRAKAAMRAQVQTQGRHLGGRPPYGYTLVDAGPHPNKAHARWGRRLQRSNLIPSPRRSSAGSLINAWQAAASQPSPAISTLNDGVPVSRRPGPQHPPHPPHMGLDHRRGNPGQPALHRPAGMEPPALRIR